MCERKRKKNDYDRCLTQKEIIEIKNIEERMEDKTIRRDIRVQIIVWK